LTSLASVLLRMRPTLVAGMDERSRKVMEEAQRRAQKEDRDPAATACLAHG